PRSMWFDEIPDVETITEHFKWPIFVKGARQTSRHSKALSIIENPDAYARMREAYVRDHILHHQQFVCREFVPLRKVSEVEGDLIPASCELRTFWWRGQFVGGGRYWVDAPAYNWTESEKANAVAVAQKAAAALPVPFLVVDVGQRTDGRWIVIEVNDGQGSGYAEMLPVQLWQNILAVERAHIDASA
ncbi:MAG: ATP-grasp domain-containing protein, partial [Chloroflexota bacterium]